MVIIFKCLLILLSIILLLNTGCSKQVTYGIQTSKSIDYVKTMVNKGNNQFQKGYNQLIYFANNALNNSPKSVHSLYIPPYYKDPKGHIQSSKNITFDAYDAYCLALAWHLSEQDKYAEKATEILNNWAINNKEISIKDDTPLVTAYGGIGLIYAGMLLKDYENWDQTNFRQWVKFKYLPAVQIARDKKNNWADWGNLASLVSYSYLDYEKDFLVEADFTKELISTQIDNSGNLGEESKRGDYGMWYTYFALTPLTQAVFVIKNEIGLNLFSLETDEGKRIKKALDHYYFYVKNPYNWPFSEVKTLKKPSLDSYGNNWPTSLFEAMSIVYKEKKYKNLVSDYIPSVGGLSSEKPTPHHLAWNFPILMLPNFQ